MNRHLPYRATTANGETIDVTFDLHAETRQEVDVSALLTGLLGAIDARVAEREGVSNGDVLQALAMAMALRVAMIPAPRTVTEPLARDLLDTALSCASFAQRVPPPQPVPAASTAAPAVPASPAAPAAEPVASSSAAAATTPASPAPVAPAPNTIQPPAAPPVQG